MISTRGVVTTAATAAAAAAAAAAVILCMKIIMSKTKIRGKLSRIRCYTY